MTVPKAEFRTLGSFELRIDGVSVVTPKTQKARALLLYLVDLRKTAHGRERLLELFWPDSDEEKARQNFNTALWAIRKNIREAGFDPDAYLIADKRTVAWIGPVSYDAQRFADLVDAGDVASIDAALAMYDGDFVDGDFEEWTVGERERLGALYERALTRRVEESRDPQAAKALLLRNPFSEAAHDVLIDAARKAGRVAQAQALYKRACAAFDELGVPPSPEFTKRFANLLQSERKMYARLPQYPTSFVGRESELEHLAQDVEQARLVTICGAGGIGKTRLAIELGNREEDIFADGVVFVQLAPVSEGRLLPDAIARALANTAAADLNEAVLSSLEARHGLLILDNCEHIVGDVASFVAQILERAPEMRILATSREPLALASERVYRLEPLRTATAAGLFVERAKARNASFGISSDSADALTTLVERLDGIPLAIELAAARANLFSVRDLLAKLDRRFEVLRSNERGGLARHQTLHATLEWSYRLLSEDEARIFALLGVFAGDFDSQAAQAVSELSAEELGEVLERLVDKSVIVPVERGGHRRFLLLETVRAFALEKLGQQTRLEDARAAHAAYFAGYAARAGERYRDVNSAQFIAEFDAELENIRVAIAYALQMKHSQLLSLFVHATRWYWIESGRLAEGAAFLDAALSIPQGLTGVTRFVALRARANYARSFGRYPEAERFATQAMEFCKQADLPEEYEAHACSVLANAHFFVGKAEDVVSLYERAIEIFERLGNKSDHANTVHNLGTFYGDYIGDFEKARTLILEAARIDGLENDYFGRALTCEAISRVEYYAGEAQAAIATAREAVRLFEQVNNYEKVAGATCSLLQLIALEGDVREARALYRKIEPALTGGVSTANLVNGLDALVLLAYAEGRLTDAVTLFACIEQNDAAEGVVRFPVERRFYGRYFSDLRTRLSQADFAGAWDRGKVSAPGEFLRLAPIDAELMVAP